MSKISHNNQVIKNEQKIKISKTSYSNNHPPHVNLSLVGFSFEGYKGYKHN